MRTRANKGRAGFTLVELAAVTLILAMIAAVVAPSILSMRRTSDRQTALSALRRFPSQARVAAVRSGNPVDLVFDDSSTEMRLRQSGSEGNDQILARISLPEDLTPQRFRFEGRDSNSTEFVLTFYPDGTSNGGGIEFNDFSILVDQRGDARRIDGQLPIEDDEKWQAGDLEQRT